MALPLDLGGAVSYDQNLSFVPVFKYGTEFGNDWNLELLLPKEIEVSKDLNRYSRLNFKVKGSGTSYTLNGSQVANDLTPTSLYKRRDITGTVGYQRQLTPWVGFSVSAGAAMPVNAGIYANDRNETQLFDLKEGISPYFKVGVFLSFPK